MLQELRLRAKPQGQTFGINEVDTGFVNGQTILASRQSYFIKFENVRFFFLTLFTYFLTGVLLTLQVNTRASSQLAALEPCIQPTVGTLTTNWIY